MGDVRGKNIGILGLAFKANTDDMRDAAAIDIISWLQNDGAKITAYDPKAEESAKEVLPKITYANEVYSVMDGADLLIILTEWNEFKDINFEEVKKRMKTPNIIDGRNLYDPKILREYGFNYIGVGR